MLFSTSLCAKLHELIPRSVRRETQAELGPLGGGPQLRIRIDNHRQHVRQRRLINFLRAESRPGNHHQAAAEIADILLHHFAEAVVQVCPRHVVKEDHVVGKELASLGRQRTEEQHVRLSHTRIRRAKERAEALHADQLVAMEDFLDEPPFPGRLVGDVHQAEVVVDNVDLATGPVVLVNDFPFHLVHRWP